MFYLNKFTACDSLDEAYALLQKSRKNNIVAGCHFLKAGHKRIMNGISLDKLALDQIEITDFTIDIGGTSTYGALEDSPFLREFASGVLLKALSHIVSRQLRNTAQVGASVYSRYGFSDFLPVLLALDTSVVLYHHGEMVLENFFELPASKRDILLQIKIPNVEQKAVYVQHRKSCKDIPVLNMCFVKRDHEVRIAVGARPQHAILLPKTASLIEQQKDACEIKEMLVKESTLGSNERGSRTYRELLLPGLFDSAREAIACL